VLRDVIKPYASPDVEAEVDAMVRTLLKAMNADTGDLDLASKPPNTLTFSNIKFPPSAAKERKDQEDNTKAIPDFAIRCLLRLIWMLVWEDKSLKEGERLAEGVNGQVVGEIIAALQENSSKLPGSTATSQMWAVAVLGYQFRFYKLQSVSDLLLTAVKKGVPCTDKTMLYTCVPSTGAGWDLRVAEHRRTIFSVLCHMIEDCRILAADAKQQHEQRKEQQRRA